MESKKNTTYGQCRCCLTKGNHRDIMKEYYTNGIREVFYDIFMECFNLFLSTESRLTTLICQSCVQRLRDASSFRMLAITTEEKLLQKINTDVKHTVFVNVGEHSDVGINVKQEDVKLEPEDSDGDNLVLCDSDYSHSNNECFAELPAAEVSGDLIEGEAQLLARFPGNTLKLLPTRASLYSSCREYVKHLDLIKDIAIVPKMLERFLEDDETKRAILKSRKLYITEKLAHIINASTLLECSNVTPFRSKSRAGFPCFYCRNVLESLEKIQEHISKEHKKVESKKILSRYGAECLVVYADVTDLKCTLCNQNIPNLNELKSHLIKIHKKVLHVEFTDRVIPFKLSSNNVYECQVCGFNFETFGSIERHMNIHFRNYVCKECGNGFVTKYRLKVHIKSMHVGGSFPCEICKKVFTSQQKHKNHVNTVHKNIKRFKCAKCPERFSEYFRRQKHMVEAHGVAPLKYKCNVCDKTFDRRYTLSRHMKRDHLEERDYECNLCAYKCFTNNELTVHMVKHNGERIFECSVCKKSYARKKTLKEHMRIHNNDRRFACAVCGQAFVQKCSLKGHIKTHHLEYSLG